MNTFRKTVLICLMVCMAIGMCATPALASDWKSTYENILLKGVGAKRTIALLDMEGDGTPELFVLSFNGNAAKELRAYDASGKHASFDMAPFGLKKVRAVSMQKRQSSTKNGCNLLSIKATSGSQTIYLQVGLTGPTNGQFKQAFTGTKVVSRGSTKYYIDGTRVSSSSYSKAKKKFESTYKKVGSMATSLVSAGDKSAAVAYKYAQIQKKYKAFTTVKSIQLSKTSLSMTAGKTYKLSRKISPASAITDTLSWSSSNETVATVSGGTITALSAGKSTITIKSASGAKKSCTVTVKAPSATKVTLADPVLTMVVGSTYKINTVVTPSAANQTVTWTSSNAKVATVSKTTGEIKAIGKGKCSITAKTSNGKSASCKLVVNTGSAVIVDISQHNGNTMDWAKVAKSVDLLILRCGVTRTDTSPIGVGKDALFPTFAKKCKEYGIPFGVYYYGKCSDTETAKKEAQMTWDVASPYDPLFYVYDVEESRLTKTVIETYMKTLQKLGAKKTGYYVAHHLYSKYKLDTSLVDFIWIPHYGKNTGAVNSAPSYACDIHQYTSVGKVNGFPGKVDVNRLMGTKSLSWFLK
ncbi:Ig-like domain-containing protein [Eubacteriales bacterium OttesenSCG-928-N13]|nr:Ig-like domain-containing protein [Eubacteriales bacterium OttesenSCG-928-N13]